MRVVKIAVYALLTWLTSCISSQSNHGQGPVTNGLGGIAESVQSLQNLLPSDHITLAEALRIGKAETISKIKLYLSNDATPSVESKQTTTKPKEPEEILSRRKFIKTFKKAKAKVRTQRAAELLKKFECVNAPEAQGLALTLERDFPETIPFEQAIELHGKVASCEGALKQDSEIKSAILWLLKDQCGKALEFIDRIDAKDSTSLFDRLNVLRKQCKTQDAFEARNPWSGYGILLKDPGLSAESDRLWTLGGKSGNPEWDARLRRVVELAEEDKTESLRSYAQHLNAEEFSALPLTFQGSLLVLLHFQGIDFEIFRLLNKTLSTRPDSMRKELAQLLYPIRYWDLILEHSDGLDPHFTKALIRQESAFNPKAQSRARARGLMQLIPSAGRVFGVRKPQELFKPDVNVKAGSRYIRNLLREFGSLELALAAYNAGPSHVRDWMERYPTPNKEVFIEAIPFAETREYIRLVMRNYRMYQLLLPRPDITGSASDGP